MKGYVDQMVRYSTPQPYDSLLLSVYQSFSQVIYCFYSSFAAGDTTVVATFLANLREVISSGDPKRAPLATTEQARGVLTRSSSPLFVSLLGGLVVPCYKLFLQIAQSPKPTSDVSNILLLGQAACLNGILRFNLLVPTAPIDPVAKFAIRLSAVRSQRGKYGDEVEVRELIEEAFTGKKTNHNIENLMKEIAELELVEAELTRNVPVRPQPSQFSEVHHDVHHFAGTISETNKVIALMNGLLQKQPENFLHQERQWQDKSSYFIQNTSSKYPMYKDVLLPLFESIYQIKHGLRTIVVSKSLQNLEVERPVLENIVSILLSYPAFSNSLEGARFLMDKRNFDVISRCITEDRDRQSLQSHLLRAALYRVYISIHCCGQLNAQNVEALEGTFGVYVDVNARLLAERKEKELQEQEKFKYKTKDHSMLSIEEKTEKDLKELFPTYAKDFQDFESQDLSVVTPEEDEEAESAGATIKSFTDAEAFELYRMHRNVFNRFSPAVSTESHEVSLPDRIHSLKLSQSATQILLKALNYQLVDLDEKSAGINLMLASSVYDQLRLTNTSKTEIDEISVSGGVMHNFYTDPNPSEALVLLKPLQEIIPRAREIMTAIEQPEHPILQAIIKICDRILNFSVNSPLMRLLTGLEILLVKGLEWEKYASRALSLKTNLDVITGIIIRYRRVELTSWPQILDAKAKSFEMKGMKWWFHLYGLFQEDKIPDDTSAYVVELYNNLMRFMDGSNYGEFRYRLEMLKTFSNQLTFAALLDSGQAANSRLAIANLLLNLHGYFSIFKPDFETKFADLRTPIEKQLKEFIKLLKWEDSMKNYLRLKETAEKSHRKLLKIAKDYDELLDTPMRAVFSVSNDFIEKSDAAYNHDLRDFTGLSDPSFAEISTTNPQLKEKFALDDEQQNHNRLEQIFKKMRRICQRDILLRPLMTSYLDGIETVDFLATSIIQNNTTINDQKLPKSAKKLTLSELLKSLESIGLSYRLQLVDQELKNAPYIFSKLPITSELRHQAEKQVISEEEGAAIDSRYYKCVSKLIQVRLFAANPSKEISRGEITKSAGFIEHVFHMIVRQRKFIADTSKNYAELDRSSNLVRSSMTSASGEQSSQFPQQDIAKESLLRLKALCDQMLEYFNEFELLAVAIPLADARITDLRSRITECKKAAQTSQESVRTYCVENPLFASHFVSEKVLSVLKVNVDNLTAAKPVLDDLYELVPDSLKAPLRLLKQQIDRESDSYDENFGAKSTDSAKSSAKLRRLSLKESGDLAKKFTEKFNALLSQFQLAVQDVRKVQLDQSAKLSGKDPFEDGDLPALNAYIEALITALRSDELSSKLQELVKEASHCFDYFESDGRAVVSSFMQRLHPFAHQYLLLAKWVFTSLLQLHKVTCRLEYHMLSIFSNLYTRGFNMPQDEKEGDGTGETLENVEGTGMGQAEGEKDVSKEIDNDEQLEDLKGQEQGEDPHMKPNVPEEGREMENDFDGNLESLDKDENNEENSDEEPEEDENQEKQMGDMDDNEEVVDEQLWFGDSEDENEDKEGEDEKQEKNNPLGREDLETEMAAKMGEEDEKEPKKEKKPKEDRKKNEAAKEPQVDEEAGEEEGEDEEPEVNEQKEMNDDHHMKTQKKEEFTVEEDAIDEESDKEEPEEMDIDDKEADEDEGEDTENPEEEKNAEENKDVENEEMVDEPEENPTSKEAMPDEGEAEEDKQGEQPPDENINSALEQDQMETENQPFGVKDDVGKPSDIDVNEMEEDESHQKKSSTKEQKGAMSTRSETEGDFMEADQRQEATQQHQRKRQDVNPYRSLGDTLKEWKKRLNIVENPEPAKKSQAQAKEEKENNAEGAFEFINNEEEKEDMQGLGATEKNAEHLEQIEEDKSEDNSKPKKQEKQDTPEQKNISFEPMTGAPPLLKKENESKKVTGDEDEEMQDEFVEEDADTREKEGPADETLLVADMAAEDEDAPAPRRLSPEELRKFREEVETEMTALQNTAENLQRGQDLWRKLEYMTGDLSQELCEQLRLILEPTLATKLRGDYRTGKRINMKKVIPYIASDFKKDKIWLRRTQPSKRTYQIMLAIDDSSSMSHTHAGQLACEAMTLIVKAMNQLEVGQISITSFGETVKLLHPFEEPFSPDSGSKVLSQFTFAQNTTNMVSLMDGIRKILEVSRDLSSENMQLVLLISDGRFDDKEDLKAAIRECEGKNIFLVFIIVDNPTNKNSVIDIQTVSYPGGRLKISRYIDNFPYSYYIVLRELNKLPQVLADALRQWFEMTKQM
eukprot:TRINITY_DN2299_c0_g1_i7.p2 TRINITY_DN2299_c0_g1~~TRINITY_DN2299_c0_g1_i7.p2  ORF type:complete len:2267 (+),score=877.38 TRINITY_DN2299_c0_g1_i7:9332-16132(+)